MSVIQGRGSFIGGDFHKAGGQELKVPILRMM